MKLKLKKKPLIIISIILIIVVAIILIKTFINKDNSINLKSLHKISSSEKKNINSNTQEVIFEWNKESSKVKLKSTKNLGFYLVIENKVSSLFDVYDLVYEYKNEDYHVYATVEYSNVTYTKFKLHRNNGAIYGNAINIGDKTMWGYEKIKDLYNSINTSKKIKIISSKGLYTK